jgi:hypothetical protein
MVLQYLLSQGDFNFILFARDTPAFRPGDPPAEPRQSPISANLF